MNYNKTVEKIAESWRVVFGNHIMKQSEHIKFINTCKGYNVQPIDVLKIYLQGDKK